MHRQPRELRISPETADALAAYNGPVKRLPDGAARAPASPPKASQRETDSNNAALHNALQARGLPGLTRGEPE